MTLAYRFGSNLWMVGLMLVVFALAFHYLLPEGSGVLGAPAMWLLVAVVGRCLQAAAKETEIKGRDSSTIG